MRMVERYAVVVRPKQPFLDWLWSLEAENATITMEDLVEDCTVYLIPSFNYIEGAEKFIKKMYVYLFEAELDGWYTAPDWWPPKRDYRTFCKWFDVSIHSMVIDLLSDEEEEYEPVPEPEED